MNSRTPFLLLGLFAGLAVYAQRFPTNNITQEQAITIASGLRSGMTEAEVVAAVDKRHKLQSAADVGSPITGWTRTYVLSNGCSLGLRFEPKAPSNYFQLSAASIDKKTGEKLISIPLTNRPCQKYRNP